MKHAGFLSAALALASCGPSPNDDPIYQALLANPPTQVPAKFVPFLRKAVASPEACEVFNEGLSNQYMTCWWSSGSPRSAASVKYYPPSPLKPPTPDRLSRLGQGLPVTQFIKF